MKDDNMENMENMDFLLDDKKLKKAYKKSKFKSTIRTIVIVILVVIPLYAVFIKVNFRVTNKIRTEYYAQVEKVLEITKPNTYISMANDTIGFLGASGQYTVSKRIGSWKSIDLYDKSSHYGLLDIQEFNHSIMTSSSSGGHKAGEWPVNFDRSGNLTMMTFHPDIEYKEYKNDIALLNKVSPDSLLEMTISLDKKYKVSEITDILPRVQISELLIDGYTNEEMEKYKKEASEYDGKATFIPEYYFIRLKATKMFNTDSFLDVTDNYDKFLDNLQFDFKDVYYKNKFSNIYSTLKTKDQLDLNKLDIIGVVITGSSEELESLKSNSHITASSVGIITKDIIFK
jgi:hypothetical protein